MSAPHCADSGLASLARPSGREARCSVADTKTPLTRHGREVFTCFLKQMEPRQTSPTQPTASRGFSSRLLRVPGKGPLAADPSGGFLRASVPRLWGDERGRPSSREAPAPRAQGAPPGPADGGSGDGPGGSRGSRWLSASSQHQTRMGRDVVRGWPHPHSPPEGRGLSDVARTVYRDPKAPRGHGCHRGTATALAKAVQTQGDADTCR